jgi:glycosyltransferase involved in cell wall biosynthesis
MRPFLAPPPIGRLGEAPPPTFSAVIAAYQAAEFIDEAIESLQSQTLKPIEIIVCDDGSTDELEAALAPYRDRIKLLRQENQGEGAAKNAGARLASGEFVAILDADDVYLPERLEALAELSCHRPDLDILTTDSLMVFDGRYIQNCYSGDYRFEVEDQRRGILERNFIGPGHMAVRRERFLAVGGFDEAFRWATDWDCWIRMIFAGSRAGMVDQALAEYRVRETGLASNRTRHIEGRHAVLEKAARRADLTADERKAVNHSLVIHRRWLAFREAHSALLERRPQARRLALRIALSNSFPPWARAKALAAAALPAVARRLLARRDGRREIAGGLRI